MLKGVDADHSFAHDFPHTSSVPICSCNSFHTQTPTVTGTIKPFPQWLCHSSSNCPSLPAVHLSPTLQYHGKGALEVKTIHFLITMSVSSQIHRTQPSIKQWAIVWPSRYVTIRLVCYMTKFETLRRIRWSCYRVYYGVHALLWNSPAGERSQYGF